MVQSHDTLSVTAATQGTYLRLNYVNNVIERASSDTGTILPIGELAGYTRARDCLWEGNSFVGQRFNCMYNNPADGVTPVESFGNSVRNNYFDWLPTKHDVFTANGALTGGWSVTYGVEFEGNVLGNRIPATTIENFAFDFDGLRSAKNPVWNGLAWPGFVDDRSNNGGGQRFGDYRPNAASPLCATLTDGGMRGRRAVIDMFSDGGLRGATFATGALTPVVMPTAAAPDSGRISLTDAGVGLVAGAPAVVRVMPALHGVSSASGGLRTPDRATITGSVLVVAADGRTLVVDAD